MKILSRTLILTIGIKKLKTKTLFNADKDSPESDPAPSGKKISKNSEIQSKPNSEISKISEIPTKPNCLKPNFMTAKKTYRRTRE